MYRENRTIQEPFMTSGGQSEKAVVEWLGGQKSAMLTLLEEIVNIDGGSYDKAGVDAVGARLRKFLEEQDVACETIENEKFGDALRATVGGPSNSAIMLMGHRDTVFRKGGVFMKMEITGKAAHSGGNFSEGISAIEELARKITALHAITDLTKGTTVNVGLVSGGQTVNTVAPWAKCEIDLRYVMPADREMAMAKIERIVAASNVPGTSARFKIA